MSGRSGDVYRAPKRDRHGDPVDDAGNPVKITDKEGLAFLGTLDDIIMGGQSASKVLSRQESSDTSGMIGCRRDRTPKVKFGDRIVIDGIKYEVKSVPEWDHNHPWTGTNFNRYWVDVIARA